MTSFNPSQIPSSVNTVEECLVWCAQILSEQNQNTSVIVGPGEAARVIEAIPVFLREQTTKPERFAVIAYLPLAAGWRGNGKIYANGVEELTAGTIPTAFTS